MDERVTLRGTWKFGQYAGGLLFTGGPRDDYLELRAEEEQSGQKPYESVALSLPDDLSLKSFADGYGLGILRLLIAGDPSQGKPAEERMHRLAGLLADSVLPDLRWENGCLTLATLPVLEHHPGQSPGSGEASVVGGTTPETPEELVGAPDDPMELASLAVERGQFGHAERFARQAQLEEDPTAAGFLEALTRARRMTRILRREPHNAQAHLELGWALLVTGATERAEEAAQTALGLNSRLGCAHALLGMGHLFHGDHLGARAAYDEARAHASADDPHLGFLAAALEAEMPGLAEPLPIEG